MQRNFRGYLEGFDGSLEGVACRGSTPATSDAVHQGLTRNNRCPYKIRFSINKSSASKYVACLHRIKLEAILFKSITLCIPLSTNSCYYDVLISTVVI